jgi:hypothetical protein
MSDGHSARRGVQTAGTQSAPGRTRLGKREWQDIRRACKLGIDGELHAVDLHGVRLTFRCQRACSGPAQDMASTSSGQEGQAAGRRNATAQRPATNPTGPSDDRRHRQGKGKQGSTRAHKPGRACTTAGEGAGRASRAPAGETAGAGPAIAQSPSACSPRRPNSRQRRSANRLVEFIRAKQAQQPATAEPPQVAAAEQPSPKRAHEDGVREGGDVAEAAAASQRRRRIVDVDYEARQEAAAALYTAWRQHALATTTTTSPKRALDDGAQEGDAKRGGGQQQLARSWRHQPTQW